MAEANGWQRLLTNSAKLVNIIGGYGYQPTLASIERCIDCAVAGRMRVMPIVLKCHRGIGPAVTGTALVADDNFSRALRPRPDQGHVLASRAQALRPELRRTRSSCW